MLIGKKLSSGRQNKMETCYSITSIGRMLNRRLTEKLQQSSTAASDEGTESLPDMDTLRPSIRRRDHYKVLNAELICLPQIVYKCSSPHIRTCFYVAFSDKSFMWLL